jgi:hypothetical protein
MTGLRFGIVSESVLQGRAWLDYRQRGWTGVDAETVWQMPTIFIGSAAQIRDDLRARRERFGLSYLVAAESARPELTEIISRL